MSIKIQTKNEMFDTFYPRIKHFLEQSVSEYMVEGKRIKGYRSPDTPRIWLRDHTHQMKGFKYFEKDMKSAVIHFIEKQMPDGSIYDTVREDGGHNRCETESDVEYLLVKACYSIWQVTGDDTWIESILPKLEEALNYSMSHPWRWSKEYNLVKRPFTIDTWDFVYNPYGERHSGRTHKNVHYEKTDYCIMHGDNSGMYQASLLLAKLFAHSGREKKREYWQEIADDFKKRTNKLCWNGRFYTHQKHLTPIKVKGVNEEEQLSLSNTYDINRGLASHRQSVSIIEEYLRRKEETKDEYFAEWFSIHPPFPDFSFHSRGSKDWCVNKGWYVNGGVLPLVGGELAKASFENGFEEYGLDILKRYYSMISKSNKTYLWYHPDGTPGISSEHTLPTDGWGSSAMLSAYIEGVAGVKDEFKLFRKVRLSPRWAITQETKAEVNIGYETSAACFSYKYNLDKNNNRISLDWKGKAKEIYFHVLLPDNKQALKVNMNAHPLAFQNEKIRKSNYVNFSVRDSSGSIVINFHES